ncbi:unnamed protein product [Psylliodes chrysocephalus]|uniref:Cytochrome P450 n=1 Tax=Psylliodes chrysocephalus TaxID=3402493 RepID=A0A9P0GCI0_9CUCU|nr:unnamed protein product [Psylliodes chrysocephala]
MLITSSIFLDFIILLVTGLYILHIYISKKHKYWKERGVYFPKPKPFVGNFLDIVLLKQSLGDWLKDLYDQNDKDFFGIYVFDDPFLVVKDPKLIKNILIKNFNSFLDRTVSPLDHSPFTAHMLLFQKNPGWKLGRSKLSAVFSSGKMKSMFPLLLESADDMVHFLQKNQTSLETRELFANYTTDVISKCALGIHSHSFKSSDSMFTIQRRKIFEFSFRNAFTQTMYFLKPNWVTRFKMEFVEKNIMEYFTRVFKESLRARTTKNKTYSDLIDIMNEIKETEKVKNDDNDEVVFCGAALNFFIAGFEPASTTISYTLYELAVNPHIQQTAREEAAAVIKKHGGITLDALRDMLYFDMSINETLRKYPGLPFLQRNCNEDFPVPDSDVVIEKGTPILIPITGLQLDEKLFPDPHKYDPERFRNKTDSGNGLYFLPFGDGQRACIGERFGRIMTKLALTSILTNFEVTKCSETPVPIIFEPKSFLLLSNVGVPLQFKKLQ